MQVGQENWGADHCMHALKQESNWLEFIKLKPERDPRHEKRMTELRTRKKVDELLRVQAKFMHVADAEVRRYRLYLILTEVGRVKAFMFIWM